MILLDLIMPKKDGLYVLEQLNKKEIQSQKEQTITELNEAVMAAPEDAAKLLTSFPYCVII